VQIPVYVMIAFYVCKNEVYSQYCTNMKLWIIKQTCSILTSIQDINDLIYMTYKSYILSYILRCFQTHNIIYYKNLDMKNTQIIHIHRSNKYGVCCWLCKNDRCVPGGLIFERTKGGNPGICNDCILCL
jgi:hypothetical protein